MQEVVDATLLEKVEASIERNKSLQMLYIDIRHDVVDAVLKGACGNTSLRKFTILVGREAAAAELQQVRPQLELCFCY